LTEKPLLKRLIIWMRWTASSRNWMPRWAMWLSQCKDILFALLKTVRCLLLDMCQVTPMHIFTISFPSCCNVLGVKLVFKSPKCGPSYTTWKKAGFTCKGKATISTSMSTILTTCLQELTGKVSESTTPLPGIATYGHWTLQGGQMGHCQDINQCLNNIKNMLDMLDT
jgi:hypothetical protein